MDRICIMGNAAGGKTRLSKRLAQEFALPILHIDSIQFLPGMKLRPLEETREKIREITATEKWIIDGYGPLDILEERMKRADEIIFVDLPLWKHHFWATKRVVWNLWSRRSELAPGCSELSLEHIFKLYRSINRIHYKMRPQMLRLLSKPEYQSKVKIFRTMA